MKTQKFPIGTIVVQRARPSYLLVVVDFSVANDLHFVRGLLESPDDLHTAEFTDGLSAVTLIDLCNMRAKIDETIRDFVKKQSE